MKKHAGTKKDMWSSKMGFVLASIGAAVGLGNIWRFPYIASENGGIWFLLPYFVCLVLVGIPLFLLESGQGFISRRAFFKSVEASTNIPFLKKNIRRAIGVFPVLVSTAILGYYLALCSWTLWFAVEFVMGNNPLFSAMQASYSPLIAFVIVFISAYLIAMRGVSRGIEPVAGKLVPALFAFLVLLFLYSLTLDGAIGHLLGLFTTGYGEIADPRTWYYALSQVLFSMSVGYGIMYTYGLHLRGGKKIFSASWEVAGADTAASVLAFLAITTLAVGVGASASGLALSFEALPAFFSGEGLVGTIMGAAFFILLFFAAYTSVLSMVEHSRVSTEFLGRAWGLLIIAVVFGLGLVSMLSYSPMGLALFGAPVLDVLDYVFGTFLAPFSALAIVLACAYLLPHKKLASTIGVPAKYHGLFIFVIRQAIPGALLLLIIFSQLSGLY